MLQQLPIEVVQAIIQCVDGISGCTALSSLRLLSRAFHHYVDPFFFHTVILNDRKRSLRFSDRLRLFREIVEAPNSSRRASYVKRLTLRLFAATTSPKNVSSELSQTLAKLDKLENFDLDCLASCHVGPPCPVLRVLASEQMPFSLKSLIWRHFECDKEPLDTIVDRHVNLERLEIPHFEGEIQLSPHVLLRLRILQCQILTALPILPGRNITHLKVIVPDDFVPVTTDSFRHIRVFSGLGKWDSVAALVRQMPGLDCLELSNRFGYIEKSWYLALPQFILSTNPHQIRNIHIKQGSFARWIDKPEDIQKCFTVLPTLRWLEAPHFDDGLGDRKFHRWNRDNIIESSSVTVDDEWDWVDGWMA